MARKPHAHHTVHHTVPQKGAWRSKINWTSAAGPTLGLGVLFDGLHFVGIDLPPDQKATLIVVIQGAQGFLTWLFRTYFTKSITPSSV